MFVRKQRELFLFIPGNIWPVSFTACLFLAPEEGVGDRTLGRGRGVGGVRQHRW